MNRRNWLVRAGTICLSSIAATRSFAADPNQVKRIVLVQGVYPGSFDPHTTTSIIDRNVHTNMYDSLLVRDRKFQITPSLAESFRRVADDKWEFKLRKNVVFHNGDPFTAQDVIFSIERVLNPEEKSPQRGWISSINAVEKVDDYTVRFTTKGPDPILPARLTLIFMLPSGYVNKVGKEKFGTQPIGTGPYKLGKWVRGDYVDLDASATYWGAAPIVKYGRFRAIADSAARVAALRAGDVHLITNLPVDYIGLVEKTPSLSVSSVPSARVLFMGLVNTRKGPLQDIRVRQAINYAVDVNSIIKNVLLGNGIRSGSVSGHLLRLLGENYKEPVYEYNPAKAKQLLAAAGYPNGFEIGLDSPSGRYEKDKEISQVVASQLGQVGIKVKLHVNEWGIQVQKFSTHHTEAMYMLGWSLPSMDPDSWFTPLLGAGEPICNFENEKINKLIEQARVTLDPQKRIAVYKELNELTHQEAPWLFLDQPIDVYGVSKLISWTARSDESLHLNEITLPS